MLESMRLVGILNSFTMGMPSDIKLLVAVVRWYRYTFRYSAPSFPSLHFAGAPEPPHLPTSITKGVGTLHWRSEQPFKTSYHTGGQLHHPHIWVGFIGFSEYWACRESPSHFPTQGHLSKTSGTLSCRSYPRNLKNSLAQGTWGCCA